MNILNESNRLLDAKYMEELFTELQLKENIDYTLAQMRKLLDRSFGAHCLEIVIGEGDKELYGMCVYPTETDLREISRLIVSGASTKEMTKFIINKPMMYVLEIDPKILWNRLYNFTPAELTSILLHELGHVTADSDFYNDLMVAYRTALFNIDKDKAKLANERYNKKDIEIGMMYILSAINTTQLAKLHDADGKLHKEQIADKFVVDNGYGKALVSTMDKFTKIYLNNYKKNDYDREIALEAESFVRLTKMFKDRRKYVISLIDTEIKTSPIKTVKSILKGIKNSLKTVIFHEGVIIDKDIIQEGFIDKFLKSPLKVTQADIDDLRIQAEMMEDWDDKTILVYKIHKRISQLATAKEKCGPDDKYRITIIENYTSQLEKLLHEVMKFKAVEKKYGVFIKYPKGYEG